MNILLRFLLGPIGRCDDVIPLTVERLREIVAQPIEIFEAAEQERTEQIVEAFRSKPFEELVEVLQYLLR